VSQDGQFLLSCSMLCVPADVEEEAGPDPYSNIDPREADHDFDDKGRVPRAGGYKLFPDGFANPPASTNNGPGQQSHGHGSGSGSTSNSRSWISWLPSLGGFGGLGGFLGASESSGYDHHHHSSSANTNNNIGSNVAAVGSAQANNSGRSSMGNPNHQSSNHIHSNSVHKHTTRGSRSASADRAGEGIIPTRFSREPFVLDTKKGEVVPDGRSPETEN
jgi:hypothetical protein